MNNLSNCSLFIGDLSKFCTEVELENLFSNFGQINDVKIKRNNNTGKTLSYGFVTYADEDAANEAMRQLDGSMFCGRKMRIRWAMYNARSQNPITESVINSVYVRFVTTKLHEYITEEDFHKVFDKYGCVQDVSIKESSVDKRLCRQSGYGFVHFSCDSEGIECAIRAVSEVDNSTFDGVTYNVELSKNLLKQFNDLQKVQLSSRDKDVAPLTMSLVDDQMSNFTISSRKDSQIPMPALVKTRRGPSDFSMEQQHQQQQHIPFGGAYPDSDEDELHHRMNGLNLSAAPHHPNGSIPYKMNYQQQQQFSGRSREPMPSRYPQAGHPHSHHGGHGHAHGGFDRGPQHHIHTFGKVPPQQFLRNSNHNNNFHQQKKTAAMYSSEFDPYDNSSSSYASPYGGRDGDYHKPPHHHFDDMHHSNPRQNYAGHSSRNGLSPMGNGMSLTHNKFGNSNGYTSGNMNYSSNGNSNYTSGNNSYSSANNNSYTSGNNSYSSGYTTGNSSYSNIGGGSNGYNNGNSGYEVSETIFRQPRPQPTEDLSFRTFSYESSSRLPSMGGSGGGGNSPIGNGNDQQRDVSGGDSFGLLAGFHNTVDMALSNEGSSSSNLDININSINSQFVDNTFRNSSKEFSSTFPVDLELFPTSAPNLYGELSSSSPIRPTM